MITPPALTEVLIFMGSIAPFCRVPTKRACVVEGVGSIARNRGVTGRATDTSPSGELFFVGRSG
jgi:hypothetical protein